MSPPTPSSPLVQQDPKTDPPEVGPGPAGPPANPLRAIGTDGRKVVVRVEGWAEIRRLHFVKGLTIREIARRTGHGRNAIRRAIRSDAPPRYERPARAGKLEPHKAEIERLLREEPRMPARRSASSSPRTAMTAARRSSTSTCARSARATCLGRASSSARATARASCASSTSGSPRGRSGRPRPGAARLRGRLLRPRRGSALTKRANLARR
jgi:hypothetical protein